MSEDNRNQLIDDLRNQVQNLTDILMNTVDRNKLQNYIQKGQDNSEHPSKEYRVSTFEGMYVVGWSALMINKVFRKGDTLVEDQKMDISLYDPETKEILTKENVDYQLFHQTRGIEVMSLLESRTVTEKDDRTGASVVRTKLTLKNMIESKSNEVIEIDERFVN